MLGLLIIIVVPTWNLEDPEIFKLELPANVPVAHSIPRGSKHILVEGGRRITRAL